MKKNVYIVHCIDTEGPMYESLEASFQRLKSIFGIDLAPSQENMRKIQNKEIDFGRKTDIVADVFAPKRINMNTNWNEIDAMLTKICKNEYRMILPDSSGAGWKYSWFCMDHVGFTGNNPRHRDAGYHNIYDHYKDILEQNSGLGDIIQFHYHPLSFSGEYNLQGTAYVAGKNIFEIMARNIIDREFFPTAYRPGFHVERPDSHWFLEQWIPFDYGNQSTGMQNKQEDMQYGRFSNWKGAPTEWYPYHPDYDDYRKRGNCRRYITRCLNMDARQGMLSYEDVKDAFEYANMNGDALLAFTDHDFRDMEKEIDRVRQLIQKASAEYAEVSFYYEDAVTAMKKILHLTNKKFSFEFDVIEYRADKMVIRISTDGNIFGTQPFFAIKTITGDYFWDNLDYGDEEGVWYYTFDEHSFRASMIEIIGVGANDCDGNVGVNTYKVGEI